MRASADLGIKHVCMQWGPDGRSVSDAATALAASTTSP
jgi:hypothetical protein